MRSSLLSRAPFLAVLCVGVLACTKQAPTPPPVIEVTEFGQLDEEVIELVREQTAAAQARFTDAIPRRDLALAFEANGLWGEAILCWENALVMKPDDHVWRYHYANCIDKSGDVERAREMMTRIVKEHPSFAPAQYHLGLLLLAEGRFEEARAPFRVAAALRERSPYPVTGLAEVEYNLENYEASESFARQAIELDNRYRPARFVLGKTLRQQGRRKDAEFELSLGAEAKPSYIPSELAEKRRSLKRGYSVRSDEASYYLQMGQHQRAIDVLKELERRYPDDLSVKVNLGVAYVQIGNPQKAKEILVATIKLDPDHAAAHLNLAAAEISLNQLLEAMRVINKSIELAPDIGRAYVVKAQIYTNMDRHADAYRVLEQAQLLDTTDGEIQGKLSAAAMRLKDYPRALEHSREASKLLPDNLGMLLNVAKCAILVGGTPGVDKAALSKEADGAYKRAKGMDAKHPMVQDFEQWYQKISGAGSAGGQR